MQDAIIGQIPGFIAGVFIALIGVYVSHRLSRHQHPKLVCQTFTFKRSLADLKDIMEDIYLQFSLGQTLLIGPIIPQAMNVSKRHSHTPNGYFDYLIQNRIQKFVFKYWDPTHKKRTLKVIVVGNQLTAEMFMLPHELTDLTQIFMKHL